MNKSKNRFSGMYSNYHHENDNKKVESKTLSRARETKSVVIKSKNRFTGMYNRKIKSNVQNKNSGFKFSDHLTPEDLKNLNYPLQAIADLAKNNPKLLLSFGDNIIG